MTSTENPFKWTIKPPPQKYDEVLKLLDQFAAGLQDSIHPERDQSGKLNLTGKIRTFDIQKEEGLLTNSGREFRIVFSCQLPELSDPYRVILCRVFVPSDAKQMKLDTYDDNPRILGTREELEKALVEFGTLLNDTGQLAQLHEVAKRATP